MNFLQALAESTEPLPKPGTDDDDTSLCVAQRLRSKRHLSLDGLARACGVRAMLAQIESGRSVPSIKVLCKIAKGLKVSVAAFLEDRAFEGVEVLPAQQSKRLVVPMVRLSAARSSPTTRPSTGDSILFYADQPHRYRNSADSVAVAFLASCIVR